MADYTTNLSLEKIAQGQEDWHTAQQSNVNIVDGAVGKIKLTDGSSGSLTAGMLVYISAENTVQEADATDDTKPAVAVCRSTTGAVATLRMGGIAEDVVTVGDDDIVAGDLIFLSTTAGKVTKTPPSGSGNIVQLIGRAVSDEDTAAVDIVLFIDHNPMEV